MAQLSSDVLALVARGRQELSVMRLVSKTWQQGFEHSATGITMPAENPLSIGSSQKRFPRAVELRLVQHYIKILLTQHEEKLLGLVEVAPPSLWANDADLTDWVGALCTGYRPDKPLSVQVGILKSGPVTAVGLERLARLPLAGLTWPKCSGINMAAFASLSRLTDLKLRDIDDRQLREAAALSMPVRDLDLKQTYFTEHHMVHLAVFSRLSRLVFNANNLMVATLAHLSALTQLVDLCMEDCQDIPLANILRLPWISNLVSLKLSEVCDPSEGIPARLAALTRLTRLRLQTKWGSDDNAGSYLAR